MPFVMHQLYWRIVTANVNIIWSDRIKKSKVIYLRWLFCCVAMHRSLQINIKKQRRDCYLKEIDHKNYIKMVKCLTFKAYYIRMQLNVSVDMLYSNDIPWGKQDICGCYITYDSVYKYLLKPLVTNVIVVLRRV